MSKTTIPPICQYHVVNGQLVLKRRKPVVSFLIYACVAFLGISATPGSAWAPSQTVQLYTPWSPVRQVAYVEPEPLVPQISQEEKNLKLEEGVVAYIKSNNPDLSEDDARMFATSIREASETFKLDLAVFTALIKVESRFKPEASSSAGALGLTQVIPKWHLDKLEDARKLFSAYSIYEPRVNIYVGAGALREFLSSSKSIQEALLKYNGSVSDSSMSYATLVLNESRKVKSKFLP